MQTYMAKHLAVVANTSCSAGLNRSERIESAPHVKVLIGSDLQCKQAHCSETMPKLNTTQKSEDNDCNKQYSMQPNHVKQQDVSFNSEDSNTKADD